MSYKMNRHGVAKRTYLESIGWKFVHEKEPFWYFSHGGEYCKMDFMGNVRFLNTKEKEDMKNAM